MTVQEAEKAGMSDIDIALGIVTGELEDESEPVEYRDPVHGKPGENGNYSVIRGRQDCFPDGRNNQPGGVKHGISTSINKKAE